MLLSRLGFGGGSKAAPAYNRQSRPGEYLVELAAYVRRHENALLQAAIKFTLDAESLQLLCSRFPPKAIAASGPQSEEEDAVYVLYTFAQSLDLLRIVSPRNRHMVSSVILDISHFVSLTTLELSGVRCHSRVVEDVIEVHVTTLRGLSKLQGQLQRLICHNALLRLSELFTALATTDAVRGEGGVDDAAPWPKLRDADCSQNGLTAIDTSLRQAPQLVKLDLSGNHLEEVENLECLARLQFLNLSYNRIASVLNIFRAVGNIATLILRGNQLASLKGIEKLVGLVRLDLRDNALRLDRLRSCRNLQEVALLADLPELTALWMQGNPMCSEAGNDIQLDGTYPSLTEQIVVNAISEEAVATRAVLAPVTDPAVRSTTPPAEAAESPTASIAIARHPRRHRRKEVTIEEVGTSPTDAGRPPPLSAGAAGSKAASPLLAARRPSHHRASSHSFSALASTSLPPRVAAAPAEPGAAASPADGDAPPTSATAGPWPPSDDSAGQMSAEEFRAWVENIRQEAGPGWLRVFDAAPSVAALQGKPVPTAAAVAARSIAPSRSLTDLRQRAESVQSNDSAFVFPGRGLDRDRSPSLATAESGPPSPQADSPDGLPRPVSNESVPSAGEVVVASSVATAAASSPDGPADSLADGTAGASGGAANGGGSGDAGDGDALMLNCKICGQRVPMDDLETHSATCALSARAIAPELQRYRCALCAHAFSVPVTVACRSSYVLTESAPTAARAIPGAGSSTSSMGGSIAATPGTAPYSPASVPPALPGAAAAGAAAAADMASTLTDFVRRMDVLSTLGFGGGDDSPASPETAPLPAPDHPMLSLDNNFRLFIELQVFSHDGETLVAFVNTSVVNLGKRDRERERERPCHFVLSDHAMYVLVDKHPGVAPPEDDPYKNLGVAHAGPLDTVSAIDIGLDRQTIVVRFGGKGVGDDFVLLLRDSAICSALVAKISQAAPDLAGAIQTDHGAVIERIRNEVLHRLDPAKEAADRAFLRQYMLAYELVQGDLAGDRLPCSMIITAEWLYICDERFHAYSESDAAQPQFTVRVARPLADIQSLALGPASTTGAHLRITFEDETVAVADADGTDSTDQLPALVPVWDGACVTARARQQLVDVLAYQWRQLMRVDLTVEAL